MSPSRFISTDHMAALVDELLAAGTRVTAPARGHDGGLDYRPIASFAHAVLDGQLPRRSLKEFFLPPTEPLFSWRQTADTVALEPVATAFAPQVVLGARPCDAAAVEILDHVMGWDYRDELWFGRRAATTIIALACRQPDCSCFCTATGLAPDATRGADLMLRTADGGWEVEIVTAKGEELVTAHAARFAEAPIRESVASPVAGSGPPLPSFGSLPLPIIRSWLASHFDHELWEAIALRCHGCGACASVCPTCHCFDIVDEPEGTSGGTRRRNWDTCQTSRFTVHASGHNPRPNQHARFRQRVMHKFFIYPEKFGDVLCTGCGRCARVCPSGMNLTEVLGQVARLAANGGAA